MNLTIPPIRLAGGPEQELGSAHLGKRQGLKTQREAVELALRTLLHLRQQEEIKRFRGKLDWQGDLDTIIATHCIARGFPLLYSDRDFDPFVEHLGLRSALARA